MWMQQFRLQKTEQMPIGFLYQQHKTEGTITINALCIALYKRDALCIVLYKRDWLPNNVTLLSLVKAF